MARIEVRGEALLVRLNPIEKVAALRRNITVLLRSVREVEVVDQPLQGLVPERVTMGIGASTAPARGVATVGPRAKTSDGGQALVVVYFDHRSIAVTLDQSGPWRLLVVSSRRADEVAAEVRRAAGV